MLKFLSFVLIYLIISNVSVGGTQITIDRNGYSNIVVAVSPDIPNDNAAEIIQNIQYMITRASKALFHATEKRAYFKDVRILIPDSWDNVQANITAWETYNKADIRVAPPNNNYGDKPYTVQSGGCGQEGEYIHFTANYLRTLQLSNTIAMLGPSDKLFVHEWAHLRYGVFDEFGKANDKKFPLFYRPQGSNSIMPNLCTDERPSFIAVDSITGGKCKVDSSTGAYDQKCIYILQRDFDPKSSLMSNQTIDSVVEFCRDDQVLSHVYGAPNKHNAMCGARSVWTVITSHPDFSDDHNQPIKGDINLDPTFTVVRSSSGSRFILVADVSGSMKDYNRIGKLYESARRWIKYDIREGNQLGLVQFNSAATTLSKPVLIDGDVSREKLIAKLPKTANGGTCIGCGLLKAIDELSSGGKGGIILLMTDGEETDKPFIQTVMPQVIQSGVRVVSIAFGRTAENKIEDLAMQTNGLSFFVDDKDNSQGLSDAFVGSMTYQPTVPSDQVTVLMYKRQFQNVNQPITGNFVVDATVGKNFVFRIDYTLRNYLQSLKLVSPDGQIYSTLDYDDVAKVALLKLPEVMIGRWSFTIKVTNSKTDSIAVTVTAQTRTSGAVPITTECYVPDGTAVENAMNNPVRILAKVMQGSSPIIGANVKVFIEAPNSKLIELDLFDNGALADTIQDDGIYSRYFVAASSSGRYTVVCEVWGAGSSYVKSSPKGVFRSINSDYSARRARDARSDQEMTGGFSRMASGGSFRVVVPAPVQDPYPPARVLDVIVADIESVSGNFSLQFTAPGDDLDQGTVSSYEIKYSTSFNPLRENNFVSGNATVFQNIDFVDSPLVPVEAGKIQNITLNSNQLERDVTYYIALRAFDEAGNAGTSSNIVSILIPKEIPTGLASNIIAAIVVCSLLLAIFIGAIIFLVIRKKYRNYESPSNSTANKP